MEYMEENFSMEWLVIKTAVRGPGAPWLLVRDPGGPRFLLWDPGAPWLSVRGPLVVS